MTLTQQQQKVGKKIVLNKKGVFFHISFHIIVHLGSPYNSTVSVFPEMNAHQKNMDTCLNITSEAKLFLKGIPLFFNVLSYLNLYLQNVKSYNYKRASSFWGSCIQIITETESKYHYACFIWSFKTQNQNVILLCCSLFPIVRNLRQEQKYL